MKMYLAAAWGTQPEMQDVRNHLNKLGHEVTSRWIDLPAPDGVDPEVITHENRAVFSKFGTMDLTDIAAADALICFTRKFSTTGGYFYEMGWAQGSGKLLAVVGPIRNIFMCHDEVLAFPEVESLYEFLESYEGP